jgi:hypothetical protein
MAAGAASRSVLRLCETRTEMAAIEIGASSSGTKQTLPRVWPGDACETSELRSDHRRLGAIRNSGGPCGRAGNPVTDGRASAGNRPDNRQRQAHVCHFSVERGRDGVLECALEPSLRGSHATRESTCCGRDRKYGPVGHDYGSLPSFSSRRHEPAASQSERYLLDRSRLRRWIRRTWRTIVGAPCDR